MTNEDFKERMHLILQKISENSGLNFMWHVISTDPDVVADFGFLCLFLITEEFI